MSLLAETKHVTLAMKINNQSLRWSVGHLVRQLAGQWDSRSVGCKPVGRLMSQFSESLGRLVMSGSSQLVG